MKKLTVLLFLVSLYAARAFGQREAIDRATDSITKEGKALCRSEWASWYGTDIFTAKCPGIRPLSGGYFSYETTDKLINIFFSKGNDPVVIASITFDKDFNSENYKLDTIQRKFSVDEHDYYAIRTAAFKRVMSGDTLFKFGI